MQRLLREVYPERDEILPLHFVQGQNDTGQKAPPGMQRMYRMMKQYYVYILASKSKTLYTGITDDVVRRVFEHKNKLIQGFTRKYNVTNLIYYETTRDIQAALQREKQIKGWLRRKKVALIETTNPEWKDLSDGWYET